MVTPERRQQLAPLASAATTDVYRQDLLGGLLHEYHQAAVNQDFCTLQGHRDPIAFPTAVQEAIGRRNLR